MAEKCPKERKGMFYMDRFFLISPENSNFTFKKGPETRIVTWCEIEKSVSYITRDGHFPATEKSKNGGDLRSPDFIDQIKNI